MKVSRTNEELRDKVKELFTALSDLQIAHKCKCIECVKVRKILSNTWV